MVISDTYIGMTMLALERDHSMLTVRVVRGIVNHFPIRKSEWGMALAAFGMALVLRFQPDMFENGKSFTTMAQWADETTWGLFAVIIAIIRFIALGVNGTFQGFGYSPHLRLFASVAGLLFWSQFVLGVLIAAYFHEGAMSAIVAYGTFCFFEGCNIFQSAWDRDQQARKK